MLFQPIYLHTGVVPDFTGVYTVGQYTLEHLHPWQRTDLIIAENAALEFLETLFYLFLLYLLLLYISLGLLGFARSFLT